MTVAAPAGLARDLGITLGDPSGIGPEIVAAVLARLPAPARARIVVFGDRGPLAAGAAAMGVEVPGDVRIVEEAGGSFRFGAPDLASGRAQVAYLDRALDACTRGEIHGLVTAPIAKAWAMAAGLAFPGHTELLADRLGAPAVAMAFYGPRLRVALATTHIPLAEVPAALSTERIVTVGRLLATSLRRDLGLARPRLGIVGLNPHAGEGGRLGDDELRCISPAVATLRGDGTFDVSGPLVPDAAFRLAAGGAFDALVAMYHDQALIPLKLLDFDDAVNVTLGLPIVRTSPDHGTAHDIAGTGTARVTSMQRALDLAFQMIEARRR